MKTEQQQQQKIHNRINTDRENQQKIKKNVSIFKSNIMIIFCIFCH